MPKLTKRLVEAIEPEGRDVFVWDSELRGFGCRVYASGQRRYVLQWKRDGRTRRLVIGQPGPVTCERAREIATELRGRIAAGEDPAEERDARRGEVTVTELVVLYLAEGCGHLKPGSKAAYRSVLKRHVIHLIGHRTLRSLRPLDIEKLIEDIINGRTARTLDGEAKKYGRTVIRGGRGIAARTREYFGAALSWAVRRGMIDRNPAEGVRKPRTRKVEACSDR